MPYKNQIKKLAEGAYYHAFNRGHNRQQLFFDKHDYHTFIYLLKKYLDPHFREVKSLPDGERLLVAVNKPLYAEVELHAYCLMPNHFHLLVKQISKNGMSKLINVVSSQYSLYFNNKYEREGTIWQGTYKAVLVKTEEQYVHLSRYIHINPSSLSRLEEYPYSSYSTYIGQKKRSTWFKTADILHYFLSQKKDAGEAYRDFVEGYHILKKDELISPLVLDEAKRI